MCGNMPGTEMTDERTQTEFLKMLRECEGTLIRVCLWFANHGSDECCDLYQEIACTLWEQWPRYRGDGTPYAWAISIALNVAGQSLRRGKRMPQFVEIDETMYDSIAEEVADPCRQRMYALIDRLDNKGDRKLLFLYLDGMTTSDIARLTGLSEAAVRQRIHRIKQRLIEMKGKEDE